MLLSIYFKTDFSQKETHCLFNMWHNAINFLYPSFVLCLVPSVNHQYTLFTASFFNAYPVSIFYPYPVFSPPFHFSPILSASHHLFFPLWIQHPRKFSEHALLSIIHAGVFQDSFKHAVRNWVHSWAKVSEEGDFYYSDALCRIQINFNAPL